MKEANLEEAKGIIHRFIIEHYEDADFDWIGSDERKKVEEIGFLVTELFTITTRCYNQMKDRYVSEEYKRMSRRR